MKNKLIARPNDPWRHPVSRDYALEINCSRLSCKFNDNQLKKCGLPSQCNIGENGLCKGYVAK